jgi:large subunit ribosomal protein L29
MKAGEMRELTIEELQEKENSLKESLYNLRLQSKLGQLENPNKIRLIKKDIARVKTIITEKQTIKGR